MPRNSWRGTLATLGLAGLVLFAAGCAQREASGPQVGRPFLPYRGPLRNHERFADVTRAVREALLPAAARVEAKLGLSVPTMSFGYRLTDRCGLGESGLARTIYVDDGRRAIIELSLCALLLQTGEAEPLLAHELTHATLNSRLGKARHDVPMWLWEGLAVFVADEVDEKIAGVLAWSDVDDPSRLIDGLDFEKHGWTDYAEDGLAMVYLEQKAGPDAARRLVELLIAGRGWREALEELSGESFQVFEDGTSAWAKAVIVERSGPELASYRQARAHFLSASHDAALPAFERLARRNDHPLHVPAAMQAAACLLALDRAGEAEAMLDRLLSGERRGMVELPMALMWSARARVALGDRTGARARCDELMVSEGLFPEHAAECEGVSDA